MKDNLKFKRLIAYFIDLLIISFLVTLLAKVNFINPMHNKYEKAVKKYVEYNEKVQEELEQGKNIDASDLINKEYIDIVYHIDYYGASYLITEIIVFICYFTILPFFNHGQTFGKEFMKIKLVNHDENKLPFWKYLLRVLLLPVYANIFLYTSLKSVIQVILVFALKPTYYFYGNSTLVIIFFIYCYADIIFGIFNKNNLALHDKLLKTKVVNYVRTK